VISDIAVDVAIWPTEERPSHTCQRKENQGRYGHRPQDKNRDHHSSREMLYDGEEIIEMRLQGDQPGQNLFASTPFRAPRAG